MNGMLLLGQMGGEQAGWLTTKLLGATLTSAEWVLWLLVLLSVGSIAIMVERTLYFSSRVLPDAEALAQKLQQGELEAVKQAVEGKLGMEAAMLREGIAAAARPHASVRVHESSYVDEGVEIGAGTSIWHITDCP